jgi:hypothetical protein
VDRLCDESRDHPAVLDALQNPPLARPDWLSLDERKRAAAVTHPPFERQPPFPVELPLIVE